VAGFDAADVVVAAICIESALYEKVSDAGGSINRPTNGGHARFLTAKAAQTCIGTQLMRRKNNSKSYYSSKESVVHLI